MTIAMVFPGQGSQSVGMMSGYQNVEIVHATFAEASDVLRQDLWRLAAEGPAEELDDTVNTQPLMLTAGVAVYRAWVEAGGAIPAIMAGHSLGEYAALTVADSLEFADALKLVRFRAQAMNASGQGTMAAIIGLQQEEVEAICRDAAEEEVLQAANYNTLEQIVIAGNQTAVERAITLATARGAKRTIMLPVSGPFHSQLMQSAADKLRERLKAVQVTPPKISVLHNADLKTHEKPNEIKEALTAQVCNPVRWVETVRLIISEGVSDLIECAPGKVLAGLSKRIAPELRSVCLNDFNTLISCLPEESR
jgi:[acyl-carrier-protein] S-malonyltransferase